MQFIDLLKWTSFPSFFNNAQLEWNLFAFMRLNYKVFISEKSQSDWYCMSQLSMFYNLSWTIVHYRRFMITFNFRNLQNQFLDIFVEDYFETWCTYS